MSKIFDEIVGFIVGDAMGVPTEFYIREKLLENPITKMVGYGSHAVLAGSLSDDISMKLCLIDSINDKNDIDYNDIMKKLKEWIEVGRKYQQCGFGRRSFEWIKTDNHEPYNSYGTGAVMRISPVGVVARDKEELKDISYKITRVSYNHPDGIKGAEAVAMMIYLIKEGLTKKELKEYFVKNYYPIDFTIKELQKNYKFKIYCSKTVPQAFVSFLESINFETAIRNAISIGWYSDTIGLLCGAISAEYYSVPNYIYDKTFEYLDDYQNRLYKNFNERSWF